MCTFGRVDDEEHDTWKELRRPVSKWKIPLEHRSTHIVKPALMWCSFGVWQEDKLLSCRHACVVYRNSKLANKNHIDEYCTYFCVQTTTQNLLRVLGKLIQWHTMVKQNLPLVTSALPVGQVQNASGNAKVYARPCSKINAQSHGMSWAWYELMWGLIPVVHCWTCYWSMDVMYCAHGRQ